MTKREFMEKVIAVVEDSTLKEFAENEIAKLDKANANRSAKRAERKKENEPIKDAIKEAIGEGTLMASEIGEKVGHSTQKVTALCRQLVEDGTLKVEDIKVTGKGKRKAYSLA